MLPIALSLAGGGLVYLINKIASSGGQRGIIDQQGPVTLPVTPVTRAPAPVAPPVVVKPAPVETKPPPVAPPPPKDTSSALPTPPVAPPPVLKPVAEPPLVERPIVALPSTPKPAPVETAPPPAPPVPPPDTSVALPTPPPAATTSPVDTRQWGPEIDVPVGDKYADYAAQQSQPSAVPATPSKPSGTQPPAGFDGALASALASGLAQHIASKQYDYDRARLKTWQTAAGLTPDGVYGNDTWGALLYYTADAPKALYKPTTPTPYPWGAYVSQSSAPSSAPVLSAPAAPIMSVPASAPTVAPPAVKVGPVPPAGFDPPQAQALAKPLAAHIDAKASNYDRNRLKAFQTAAGIAADGIYGGGSRRALIFYGVPRPPAALFKPTATPATYPWEAEANAFAGT